MFVIERVQLSRSDADALDGFEFVTMAEAAEVGHWSVLRKLNELGAADGILVARWSGPGADARTGTS